MPKTKPKKPLEVWKQTPEEHDFPAAAEYLSLLFPEPTAQRLADQLRNAPTGRAAALRGIGAGAMTPVWDRLHELTMPVTVLAGERDARYCALGARLAEALPRGELRLVAGGHTLPLENPAAVAEALGRDALGNGPW